MGQHGSAQLATRTISQRLAERIGHHTYDMWFGDTTRLEVEGSCVRVATETRFVFDWINGHFRRELDGAAREALGERAQVDLRVAPDLFERANGTATPALGPKPGLGPRRQTRASAARCLRRLEDFVIGPCNRLAYAAARRIADGPQLGGSPLFVHGHCGVGPRATARLAGLHCLGIRHDDLR